MMSAGFTCHWDENGTDPGTETVSKSDREFLCVAGYMARVSEWEQLEDRWKAVLLEYSDLALPETGFHMAQFANRRRPYSTLDKDRYEALIQSLLDILRDCPRMRFSWSLSVEDYMNVIKARNLLETDIVRAFHILARKCIEIISDLARIADYKPKILHVFDQGNSAWPTFEPIFTAEMLEGLNIYRPTAQSRKDIVSLQAADVLAHQVGRFHALEIHPEMTSLRLYVNRLFQKPGLAMRLGSGELLNAYQEELELERARSERRPLSRSFGAPVNEYHRELARELFRDDGGYPFDGRLRSLQ